MSEVDLKSLLNDELQKGASWLPTLQDVATWSVQFGNFAELISEINCNGGNVTITPKLLTEFVNLTSKRYGALVVLLVSEYVKLGRSTVVEIDTSESNLPVELTMARAISDSVLTTKDNMN